MKKVLSLSLIFILILTIFVGCNETFNMDKSITKLRNQGLVVSREYKTDYQLKEATAIFNAEIKFYGGNFAIEVKRAITLEDPKEPGLNCQFIEFASAEQAEKYATFYITSRKLGNEFKIAFSDTVVVITSLDSVTKVVPLEFK